MRIFNAPKAFAAFFKIMKLFLDEVIVKKIQVSSTNTCPDILEMIAPNQLEQKFGGTAPDREEGSYWPPNLPDTDFGVE